LNALFPLSSIQFNSVYFVKPNITNYKLASGGLTICTHITSLSQDLTLNQEKLPRYRKNPFMGNKLNKPSGEQQTRIPLPGWTEAIDVM